MAIEAISEYLQASAVCLSVLKPDGGCLGYPATLLLFCAVNAMGVCLAGETVTIDGDPQRIATKQPFRIFNHECFGLELSELQIKRLEASFRNRLAHNAIIDLGSCLDPSSDEPPFVFNAATVSIRVFSFHNRGVQAYSRFPKERIHAWAKSSRSR